MSEPTPASVLPDLTAILVAAPGPDAAAVRRAVLAGPYGDVWLRVRPLPSVGLTQVELFDERGQPRVDPALVAALSGEQGRATFVHHNGAAGQALVHSFAGGKEIEGWMGDPKELDEHLRAATGHGLAEVVAADDGSRAYLGNAASSTVALVRGRPLSVPPGAPLWHGNMSFHDRGRVDGAAGDRVALLAYDAEALRSSWQTVPGAELAARVRALPDRVAGPLRGAREQAASELAALGDETPEAAELRSVAALELVMLTECYFYAAGESSAYIDGRLLPVFSLMGSEPQVEDEAEADELEARPSVLAAMVEVLPFKSPEGSMLEQLDDAELRPLASWARGGEEYVGSVFQLVPERLRRLLALDQRELAARVDGFYRAFWKEVYAAPLDEDYETWRREFDERGSADVQRFLSDWSEWRLVLELAAMNGLQPALLFYEDGAGDGEGGAA